MDHIAIMNPAWKLIPKILSGEKIIESRWYQTRRAPWNTVRAGDRIFFKDSGKLITAQAVVEKVAQFEFSNLEEIESVVQKYGKKICLINTDVSSWGKNPKYCILMWLENPKLVTPFAIDKKGFGAGVAWMSVENIENIKVL